MEPLGILVQDFTPRYSGFRPRKIARSHLGLALVRVPDPRGACATSNIDQKVIPGIALRQQSIGNYFSLYTCISISICIYAHVWIFILILSQFFICMHVYVYIS